MANNHSTLTGLFTDIADAIREKTGGTDSIVADNFPEAISAIDTQENLDFELATQDAKIEELRAALEGKASGGSRTEIEDAILTRNLIEYTNNRITTIGVYAFCESRNLVSVSLSALTRVNNNVFQACKTLTSVNIPSAIQINMYAFNGCIALPILDLPLVSSIYAEAFLGCSALQTLVLRNSNAVCTLSNITAFTGTPIASGTGYIYVPAALLKSYKTATNWSTYAAQFRAIEDYTVDGTVTGELDLDKCSNGSTAVKNFSINGVTYQYDDSCSTWYDWCNSAYNIDGYVPEDRYGGVFDSTGNYLVSLVTADMLIIENEAYDLEEDW